MNYAQISALLEKYWEGQTSLEEERRLKGYFSDGPVDPRLRREAALFGVLRQEQAVEMPAARRPVRTIRWSAWAVAASVAALVLLGLFGWQRFGPAAAGPAVAETPAALPEDTYDDPEKAAEEIKAALALVSSKLNKGKKAASKGLKKMETVDRYLIAPQ
jgi:hypothetical protein